ncbi:hypothetical protein NE237_008674 [Protea cynaroides]|uniref:DUF7755 domain-containing protein n=1 Tax=Protea cynaroides TaxID=273540 RepID=A0A9Q0QZX1_9MAGN|nr:hypothetical protein NE237_008674 [Protea cynaroides]
MVMYIVIDQTPEDERGVRQTASIGFAVRTVPGMEAISLRHIISPAHNSVPVRWHQDSIWKGFLGIRGWASRTSMRVGHSRLIQCSKRSDFTDFQGFARPSNLLPATEVNICTESSLEKLSTSSVEDESRSRYMIKLHTSRVYGSCLSDLSAGILLCVIDENGDSILQRIPASPSEGSPGQTEEMAGPDLLYFQRGSVNNFIFEGPKIGKIEVVWIGLESGHWRLGGLSFAVVCGCQPPFKEEDGKTIEYTGTLYNFEAEDLLLGEGGDMSMVELRPLLVTEMHGVDLSAFLNMQSDQSTLPSSLGISNEESMREYADLKFSLLLYDTMLIFAGTSIASFSAGDRAALAFLIGGLGGFLYLILLQRSVDGLPAPASISLKREGENLNNLFRGVKGPLLTLALALAFSVAAVKYKWGDAAAGLTAKEVMVGMMGFLACKISVVLAAFKPMPMSMKETGMGSEER